MSTFLNLIQLLVRLIVYAVMLHQGVSWWWLLLIEATASVHWKST